MTRAQQFAYRLRWLILITGLSLVLVGMWAAMGFWPVEAGEYSAGFVGTPAIIPALDALDDPGFYINNAIFLGLLLVMQWMFLRPRRQWAPAMARKGRPMRSSVITAAMMTTLLSVGFLATLMDLPQWWEGVAKMDGALYGAWATMLALWVIWSIVFFIYWRQGDRYTQMGRMIRGLLAGSFLETFVATGVQVWNPNQEDCYCARGSYTGVVFGLAVLLWCFGPGIVLLFMREHYRRAQLTGAHPVCLDCGYDLRGTIEANRSTCPECGATVND